MFGSPNVPITLELWRAELDGGHRRSRCRCPALQTNVHDDNAGHCNVDLGEQNLSVAICDSASPATTFSEPPRKTKLATPFIRASVFMPSTIALTSIATPIGWEAARPADARTRTRQKKYQPGETARILVKSPFKEATAFVTVERAGLFDQKVVPLRGKMPVVDVPIKDEYFPNAFVSVHVVRGRVATMPEPGAADVGAPEYRVGYVSLRVDPESRRLKVDVSAARKEYHPGEQVEAKVALRRLDGAAECRHRDVLRR